MQLYMQLTTIIINIIYNVALFAVFSFIISYIIPTCKFICVRCVANDMSKNDKLTLLQSTYYCCVIH